MTTKTEGVILSEAGPGDADVAALLAYDTAPPMYDYLFGGDRELMLGFLSEAWQGADGIWSHRFCRAATLDGRLVGINVGFTAESLHNNVMATMGHAEESLKPEAFARLAEGMGWFSYLSPPVPEDAHYILTLAVRPELQKQGVGKMMLEDTFRRCAMDGFAACHLDVLSINEAVGFYKAMGMEHYSVSQVPRLEEQHGVPAFFRMVKNFG